MSRETIPIIRTPAIPLGEEAGPAKEAPAPQGAAGSHSAGHGHVRDHYAGTNRAVLGEALLCAGDRETYGRCAPIHIEGRKAMMVVHPSTDFDLKAESEPGGRAAVTRALAEQMPVIFLVQAYDSFENMFLRDLNPTHFVRSYDGIHTIDFEGDTLIIAGGYLQNCLRTALREILKRRRSEDQLTIKLPMDAIYAEIHDVGLLSDKVAAQEDPAGYLREQVAQLIRPRPSDIETPFEAAPRFYDVEVCFMGACRMLSPPIGSVPTLKFVFE